MNDRMLTPIFGFVLGWVSYESLQNILYSLLIAFLGGIAAWFGKLLCDYIFNKLKSKKSRDE
jgi:hypothetical protein